MNPYSVHKIWSEEIHAAYQSMPKNRFGQVVSLFYTIPAELPRLEEEWRVWLRAHPRRLWPEWIAKWGDAKKREESPRRAI